MRGGGRSRGGRKVEKGCLSEYNNGARDMSSFIQVHSSLSLFPIDRSRKGTEYGHTSCLYVGLTVIVLVYGVSFISVLSKGINENVVGMLWTLYIEIYRRGYLFKVKRFSLRKY